MKILSLHNQLNWNNQVFRSFQKNQLCFQWHSNRQLVPSQDILKPHNRYLHLVAVLHKLVRNLSRCRNNLWQSISNWITQFNSKIIINHCSLIRLLSNQNLMKRIICKIKESCLKNSNNCQGSPRHRHKAIKVVKDPRGFKEVTKLRINHDTFHKFN